MGVPAPAGFRFVRRGAFLAAVLLFPVLPAAEAAGAAGPPSVSAPQPPRPLRVVTREATRTVGVRRVDGAEMVGLRDLGAALGGSVRPIAGGDQILLVIGDRVVRFDRNRSFVTVEGRMRVLREPSRVVSGEWFVPLDFVVRVLSDVLPGDSEYDARERVLFRGASTTLRVEVTRTPGTTRITVRTDPPVPLGAVEGDGRVVVPIPVPFLETTFGGEAPRDGVVEEVNLSRRSRDYLVEVVTGPNYGRVVRETIPGGIRLDLIRAAVRAADRLEDAAREAPPLPLRDRGRLAPEGIRTVVIDPGHGGSDIGVTGSSGVAEKDLALLVALALRDLLLEEYGLRVILTRDRDRDVPPDDRAAFANAARADVMVSIHLNASLGSEASGSHVYYYAPARSARSTTPDPAFFVPWEDSQIPWAPESRRLAEALLVELEGLPVPARSVAGAPLLVLGRAAMPAVLIELGFLTSTEDEPHLVRPEFAGEAARAIAAGLMRYRTLLMESRATGMPG